MYLKHYDLKLKPFEISPDPDFFWISKKHKEAFLGIKYSIKYNIGFLLLTGDIGTGKTSLIKYILRHEDVDIIPATIVDPDINLHDAFKILSLDLNLKLNHDDNRALISDFKKFLRAARSRGKKVIVVIDEAQRLNRELVMMVRLLFNMEHLSAKLVNLIFVAQSEFEDLIADRIYDALDRLITAHYSLEPFSRTETLQYVKHRLLFAGAKRGIFTHGAIDEIFEFARGYPRLTNIVCDRALFTGYVSNKKTIDKGIVRKCADKLKLSH